MIDIIIRDCGSYGYLPIIAVTETGKELFRGSHRGSKEAALVDCQIAWEQSTTGNIIEFKQEKGLS